MSENNWQITTVGGTATLNYGVSLPQEYRVQGEVPVYGSSGITGYHNVSLIDEEGLIIGRKGNVGTIYRSEKPFYPIDTVYYITQSGLKCDLKYYYYLLLSINFKKLNSDSAVPGLNRQTAYGQKIIIPTSVSEQKSIASVLLAYDELISNNERRIKILEEMAQRLYTEWFVKYKFPGHEKVKLIDSGTQFGMIPVGWEVVPMSDLADFVNGYPFKPVELGSSGLPIVKIPELRSGILGKTPRNNGQSISKKYLIRNGDILFSWSAILLVNIWNSGEALLNQHLFKVEAKKSIYKSYTYYTLKKLVDRLSKQVVGATMQHLRRGMVVNAEVLLPAYRTLEEYENSASLIMQRIGILKVQNNNLTKMRDLLVPQLVTGKLSLKTTQVKKTNEKFRDAVIIANITNYYTDKDFNPTHIRITKSDYFVYRFLNNNPEPRYSEYMFGPYDPKTTYSGGESIAIKRNYIKKATKGFVPGDNINEAIKYASKDKDVIEKVVSFLRYKKDTEIELLATVDFILYKMLSSKSKPNSKLILDYIENSSVWKQKINRLSIDENKINAAINSLRDFAKINLPYPTI